MQQDLVKAWDMLPLTWTNKVAYLTHQFLKLEQTECPVEHIFEGDKYIREMTIPAGTLFLGRTHRHGHEVQLLKGSVIHVTEHGKFPVDAYHSVHTTPGYNMVAYIVTDVVCRSVHPNPTGSRDIQALEDDAFESVEALNLLGKSIHEQMEGLWLA